MCKRCLDYGFPTVMGRGLFGEFKNFVNPPFLIVTMPDLWEMFAHEFEGADYKLYLTDSIEQADLDRDAAALTDIRAVIGLVGGQALDVAKWFAWRRNLPLSCPCRSMSMPRRPQTGTRRIELDTIARNT